MKATLIFLFMTLSEFCLGMEFTALEIDNHPCKPENLKVHFSTTILAADLKALSNILINN